LPIIRIDHIHEQGFRFAIFVIVDSVTLKGRSLVRKAGRINSGARHLIADGGTPDMLDKCRLEMAAVSREHGRIVAKHERTLLFLLKKAGA
jgi:hypothetical protein